ncbi:hypothetical protein TNCV_5062411 [Trichonephila clavipes]|nr:hypothetical protein TNCV_5062411 [Trichonephila clavipes]
MTTKFDAQTLQTHAPIKEVKSDPERKYAHPKIHYIETRNATQNILEPIFEQVPSSYGKDIDKVEPHMYRAYVKVNSHLLSKEKNRNKGDPT